MTAETLAPAAAEVPDPRLAWPATLAGTLSLRINPMPGRRLGDPELRAVLRILGEAQARTCGLREQALAELYALAADLTGRQRHRVLTLKRAIYNDRDPQESLAAGCWPPAVSAWLDAQQRARLARTAVRAGHPTFLAAERGALSDLLGYEPFQLGLALNAPQVLDAVVRYRGRVARLGPRERKSERGLLQYTARAMVRTSPLSWFTAVALGTWSDDGPPLDRPRFDRRLARSFVTVDRVLFGAIVTGLVEAPAGAVPTVLASNPTVRADGAGVRFQRRVGGTFQLVRTPATPHLRVLLDLTAMGPLPADLLAQEAAARLRIDVPAAAAVVAAAVRAGVLVAGPLLDEQAADPLRHARAVLGAGHPASVLIGAAEREIGTVTAGSVAARRPALARLNGLQDGLNARTSRPSRLQLNEDVVLPTVTVSRHGYQGALDDLAAVAELGAVFDPHHVLRELLTAVFIERFGSGGSAVLVDCGAELTRAVTDRARSLAPGVVGNAATGHGAADVPTSLAELLTVRERIRRAMVEAIRGGPTGAEVQLPPTTLRALAEALPGRFRRRPASYGMLVQPVDGRLVLNDCYSGHNLLGMRFLGPAQALGDETGGGFTDLLTDRVRRLFGDDGIPVREDYGLHGSNVNHRNRPSHEVITPAEWTGVRLVHHPGENELGLVDRAGRPLRVMSLGMRWVDLLPAPLRIAMWLSDTSRVVLDPITWARRRGWRGEDPSATVDYPRLAVGAVVWQRRRWYLGADFPGEMVAEDEPDHLVAVTRWRANHGVPEEIVIKSTPEARSDVDLSSGVAWYQRAHRRSKPQYVDLASALMVRVLPRLLHRRGPGFVEEALPAVREGRHAFEWVVEYDRPAGGHFTAKLP